MGRIGFWQLLLDDRVSYWEAQKINELHDDNAVTQAEVADAHFDLRTLRRRVEAMSREIVMLRTALTVLTGTLKDTKVVDDRLLEARLEAAMTEAFPPQPSPADLAEQRAKEIAAIRYTCVKCRQSVQPGTTSMTPEGPVCDRCP